MADERRRPGRPATGMTPTRSVRVGDVWDEAMKVSRERGESLGQVITRALEGYVAGTLVCTRCGCVLHPTTRAVHERYHEAVDYLIDTSTMDELLKAERLERGE